MAFSKLLKGAALVFVLSMLGRITGFLREVAIAYSFGTSEQADALIVGLTPIVLFTGILGSAYAQAAMVQIKDGDADQRILRTLVPMLTLSVLISVLLVIFAPLVIDGFAAGMSAEGKAFATSFTRLAAPAILFAALAAWSTGLSHLRHRFAQPAAGALMPNLGLLAGIIVGFQWAGVTGLAVMSLLGYVVHFLMVAERRDYRLRGAFSVGFLDPEQRQLYRNAALTVASSFVVYVDLTLDRWLAIQISEGAVAALNYAFKLAQLPLYTLIFTIITIMFPRLIQAHADLVQHKQMKQRIYIITAALSLVVTVATIALAQPLVRLVFEYGVFDATSTDITAKLLKAYGLGFIGHAFVLVGSRVRFSTGDFVTPVLAGVCAAILKIALDFLLVTPYGVEGLAYATTIAACANALILIYWPARKPKEIL